MNREDVLELMQSALDEGHSDVPPGELARVIAGDAELQELWEDLKAIDNDLAAIYADSEPVPADLHGNIMQSVATDRAVRSGRILPRFFLTAAALLIAVAGGSWLYNQQLPPGPAPTPGTTAVVLPDFPGVAFPTRLIDRPREATRDLTRTALSLADGPAALLRIGGAEILPVTPEPNATERS